MASIVAFARSRPFAGIAAILGAVAVLAFGVAVVLGENQPSTVWGEGLGIAAVLVLVGIMAYSVRRSMPANRRLGRTQQYLEVHLWGGLLFGLLLLLHTDFRVPRSGFGMVLWTASVWVVVTGTLGWFLQWLIPKILTPASTFEVNLRRIPELIAELRTRAEAVAREAEPRVRSFYEQQFAPAMAGPLMSTTTMFGRPRGTRGDGAVELLRRTLAPESAAALDTLCEIRSTKHDIDLHFTLQRVLRVWMVLHVPMAVALLGLVLLHIFFIAYF
jgi:hypothetical protein